jgi:hypothetical protein
VVPQTRPCTLSLIPSVAMWNNQCLPYLTVSRAWGTESCLGLRDTVLSSCLGDLALS